MTILRTMLVGDPSKGARRIPGLELRVLIAKAFSIPADAAERIISLADNGPYLMPEHMRFRKLVDYWWDGDSILKRRKKEEEFPDCDDWQDVCLGQIKLGWAAANLHEPPAWGRLNYRPRGSDGAHAAPFLICQDGAVWIYQPEARRWDMAKTAERVFTARI